MGDEPTVGSDARVVIRDPDILDLFWAKIRDSYPYGHWNASGYRRVEFFVDPDSSQPDAVLSLNNSDLAFVQGADRWRYDEASRLMTGGYRCVGLHALIITYLEAQYHLNKSHKSD